MVILQKKFHRLFIMANHDKITLMFIQVSLICSTLNVLAIDEPLEYTSLSIIK